MENLIVIVAMLFLCVSAKDKRLLKLIGVSCAALQILYMSNIDIALYYGACAMISAVTAFFAVGIGSISGRLLALAMLVQSMLCLFLIPDWGLILNEALQFKLSQFNDILVIILIALGVTGSDNSINNCLFASYHSNGNSSRGNNGRD